MRSRQEVVNKARSWVGLNEADGSFKQLIDLYNSHTPLARGVKMQYDWEWCATFVSALAIALGYTDIIPVEIMELQTTYEGGFMEELQRVIAIQDQPTISRLLKKFILDSYGERSADGMYFFKEDEKGNPLSRKFKASPVYDILYMELMTDDAKASEFIQGIIPSSIKNSKEYQDEYAKQAEEMRKHFIEQSKNSVPVENKVVTPPWTGEVVNAAPVQGEYREVDQRGAYNVGYTPEEYRK